MTWMRVVGALLLVGSLQSWGQAAKPEGTTKLSGCVTPSKTVEGTLVLHSANSCTKVQGKLASTELAGHVVSLEGKLSVATQKEPETLQVTAVTRIGEACSETCTLEPPGKRSMRKKEIPAKDASTPGNAPTKPKPGETNGPTR